MNEVYRAMKTLDFEWKVINPYHVHVRRKKSQERDHHIKMSLQLYQVDYKSFLLDFKSLPVNEDGSAANSNTDVNPSKPFFTFILGAKQLLNT